jgi:EAL domain-containing protein (putative c-di-GMP-specific phosphodiesterase class I)
MGERLFTELAPTRAAAGARGRDAARIRRLCNEGDLTTVFQPVFELGGGARVAVEALTRFPTAPDRSTAGWFSAAAEAGVGTELELAAVRSALAHLDELPADVSLCINVSATTATTAAFRLLVAPVAHRLIIELTEHEPVEDYDVLEDALEDLRRRGARIAVDDVGAGFASLRHVLRLTPDIVKLDLSLTREIESHPGRQALASALVEFAAQTGTEVAAEGIETQAELDLLRRLGVDQGQGFFLGRPTPMAEQLQ